MPGSQSQQQPNQTVNSPAAPAAATASNNSLKSGPQVLIKNINGKVTITPVPGTGATPVNTDDIKPQQNTKSKQKPNQAVNSQQQHQSANQMNGKKSPPQVRQLSSVVNDASLIQKSHSVPNVNGHIHKNHTEANHDTNYHRNLLNDKQKYFHAADGDDPGKKFIQI